ncbi:MAG: response regulator [Elusimicrobiota bacterium]
MNLLSDKDVLFVDDNDSIRQTGKLILESWDMNVIEAANGKEAIAKTKKEKPDIILLDVGLPTMNGFEVCQTLKDNPDTKEIPVLLFTGRSNEEDIDRGYKFGANDYLVKPVDWESLKEKISNILK